MWQRWRWYPAKLLWRVFGANVAVFIVGGLLLALSPATISSPIHLDQAIELAAGIAAMVLINLVLMRRLFHPLGALAATMARVDPLQPGQRVNVEASGSDLIHLADSFNQMLDRLEDERRDSARREAQATDAEQRRIAGELHDEIGQRLTLLLLMLANAQADADAGTAGRLQEIRDLAHTILDDLRKVVVRLRPQELDELGVENALAALASSVEDRAGARVTRDFRLPADIELPPVVRLVVYRVAQEALTNAIRHAPGAPVHLALDQDPNRRLRLRVRDEGPGMPSDRPDNGGTGIRWMAERALLVGGTMTIDTSSLGTTMTLTVPVTERQ